MRVTLSWRLLTRPPKLPTGAPIGADAIVAVDAGIAADVDDGVVVGRSACFWGGFVGGRGGKLPLSMPLF